MTDDATWARCVALQLILGLVNDLLRALPHDAALWAYRAEVCAALKGAGR